MKQALALSIGAALIIVMTCEARSQRIGSPEKEVKVCHVEGNGKAHVIIISENAVKAHLAHGDSLNVAEGLKAGARCTITGGVLK